MNKIIVCAILLAFGQVTLLMAEHSDSTHIYNQGASDRGGKPPGVIGQPQFHFFRFPQICTNERNESVTFNMIEGKISTSILPDAICSVIQKPAFTRNLYCEKLDEEGRKRVVSLVYNKELDKYEAKDQFVGLTNSLNGAKVDVLNGKWLSCAQAKTETTPTENSIAKPIKQDIDIANYGKVMDQKDKCLKDENGSQNLDKDAQSLYEALAMIQSDKVCKKISVIKSKQQYLTRGTNPCIIQLDPKTSGIGGGTILVSLADTNESFELTWDANHLEEMSVEKWFYGSTNGPSNGHVGFYKQLAEKNVCPFATPFVNKKSDSDLPAGRARRESLKDQFGNASEVVKSKIDVVAIFRKYSELHPVGTINGKFNPKFHGQGVKCDSTGEDCGIRLVFANEQVYEEFESWMRDLVADYAFIDGRWYFRWALGSEGEIPVIVPLLVEFAGRPIVK